MKTTMRWFAAVLAFGGSLSLCGQNTQQVTVNAIVPVILNLTVDTNSVMISFAQGDYNAAGVATKEVVNATTFKVLANTRWRLYTSANSQYFSFTPTAGRQLLRKRCEDLSLSANGTNNYFNVSTANKDIARGSSGGTGDRGHTIPVSYKLVTELERDSPGTYMLTLTYTLMPQ